MIQKGKELTPFFEHLSFGIHIQPLLTACPHEDMSWSETSSAEAPILDQNRYYIYNLLQGIIQFTLPSYSCFRET